MAHEQVACTHREVKANVATTVPFLLFDGATDEQLLTAALKGDSAAWTLLVERFRPYLDTIVRRRAWDLPHDLRGEIIIEIWTAASLRGAAAFDPRTAPARDHVSSFVKDSVDRVRAAYRAPGARSRARDARRGRKRPRSPGGDGPPIVLSLDQVPELEQPEALSQWEQTDRGIDIDRAQALVTRDVALAIDMIRHLSVTFEEAALMVGLTRGTLLRRLAQLGERLRAA